MISKNEIKFIKSLSLQKFRRKNNLFKVEGWRTIKEFLNSDYILDNLFVTKKNLINNKILLASNSFREIKQVDLDRMSSLKTSNHSLAVFKKKIYKYKLNSLKDKLIIALEDVSNPGNLGSVIRIADWFGIQHIFCSLNSVDLYNPKVVQSSMGSLSRVCVHYVDLFDFLSKLKNNNIKTLAADLGGDNLYNQKIQKGVIFFGKESSGLSKEILSLVDQKVKIPSISKSCDSLNLSISCGIILSEIIRQKN